MWCLLWQKMLHEGDIYVGVTVRAICTKTLKQYDTKRYEKLSWKNPNPNPGPVNHDILCGSIVWKTARTVCYGIC